MMSEAIVNIQGKESGSLPANWVRCRLPEIAAINPTLDKSEIDDDLLVSFVPMPAVEAETGGIDVGTHRKFAEVKKGYTGFLEGDVLFAKITPCMENGKMAVVPALKNDLGFGSTEFHVLRPAGGISPSYLYYFVSSKAFRIETERNMTGAVGQRRVPTTFLSDREIPLPPAAEQQRIVAKLDELFSELDKSVENLRTAQQQLKVYRQALLKHAFEGKLTAEWRAQNPDKLESVETLLARVRREREARYQQQLAEWQEVQQAWEAAGKTGSKPARPKAPKVLPALTAEELAELPELPIGWHWVRPEEIAAPESYSIGIGPFGSNLKVEDYRESGVPLIFVRNITRSDFARDLKYVDQTKFLELIAHSVKPLDLVITKMGDPPGDCEIYPAESPIAVLTADCLKFRLWSEFADRQLYKSCINSNLVRKQLGLITKGVAQKKISVDRFKTICLPLMCIEEQKQISQELDEKLSVIDQLEQTITTSLQQAEALRQSILKKAFSGQLVPQHPGDEPVSVLLERIRAERAAPKPTAKRGRKVAKSA